MTSDGTPFEQGDIVLMPFPFSDLTESKLRPALIVSNTALNTTRDRLCCLVTSNPDADGIRIPKSALSSGELRFASKVRPQRLFTASTRIFQKKLCSVDQRFQKKVKDGIDAYLEVR